MAWWRRALAAYRARVREYHERSADLDDSMPSHPLWPLIPAVILAALAAAAVLAHRSASEPRPSTTAHVGP